MTDKIQHTSSISEAAPKRFQCRHIHTEGRRCGSASLRGEEFCYFHHTSRKPVPNPRTRRSRQATFDLPLPEDRGAIQISIGEVLRRIASNQIDPRRAGLLLYGLQIASLNLPKPAPALNAQQPVVEEVISDPNLGPIAPSTELPDPDAPRPNSLMARLLDELRRGRELDAHTGPDQHPAEPHPSNPVILSGAEESQYSAPATTKLTGAQTPQPTTVANLQAAASPYFQPGLKQESHGRSRGSLHQQNAPSTKPAPPCADEPPCPEARADKTAWRGEPRTTAGCSISSRLYRDRWVPQPRVGRKSTTALSELIC